MALIAPSCREAKVVTSIWERLLITTQSIVQDVSCVCGLACNEALTRVCVPRLIRHMLR